MRSPPPGMLFPRGISRSVFWAALWGALSALVLGGLLLLLAGRKIGDVLVDSAGYPLMRKDPYPGRWGPADPLWFPA